MAESGIGWGPSELDAYLVRLNVPGIVDLHVHFMPARVMAAVWRYFDDAGPLLGRTWPIRYRGAQSERIARLRGMGVRRFAPLAYAHKPGMAPYLTEWLLDFAARVPEAVATGTFYPEPGVHGHVAAALERGCRLFKVHLQVGDFDPRDPALTPVWGMLADAGVPVVVHAGSGPVPGRYTGPVIFGQVMRQHPDLLAVVAHFGMPEEEQFLELCDMYPAMMLDTTMVGTDFLAPMHRMSRNLLPRVRELGAAGRIVFGSDFPNIPYRYAHQVQSLARWDLGEDWMRAVLWDNGRRLVGAAL